MDCRTRGSVRSVVPRASGSARRAPTPAVLASVLAARPRCRVLALLVCAGVLAGLGGPPPAAANPLPGAFVLVHVHPWEADFCTNHGIVSCEEIVQHTDATGDLEFDLFIHEYLLWEPLVDFSFQVEWPEGWQLTDFESCVGGSIAEDAQYDRLTVQISVDPPVEPTGMPVLVGRIRMQVDGPGSLSFPWIVYNGMESGVSEAQAGADLCYCFVRCDDFSSGCGTNFQQSSLDLEVVEGSQASGVITGYLRWPMESPGPCGASFVDEASWLDIDVDFPNPDMPNYLEITVTADAATLPPGPYETLVRSISECIDCVTVRVEVLPGPVDVGEGAPEVRTQSWGKVKETFR